MQHAHVIPFRLVKAPSATRIRWARAIAVGADMIQLGLPYVFGIGFFSPFDDALDLAVCMALTLLVGWHLAFLPSFALKLLPVVDLAPTWTIAVLLATRGKSGEPPVQRR